MLSSHPPIQQVDYGGSDARLPRDPGGRDHALVFRARVGDREIQGCDFLHLDEDGLIDEFTVMVRPLSGATALAEAMGAQFDRITREAEEAEETARA